MDLDDFDRDAYVHRIRLLRRLHGMNQTEFAAFVGIEYKKWHHYERGYPISRETAFILRRKIVQFTFRVDWLWHGDETVLPQAVVERIRAFEKEDRKARRRLAPTKPLPQTAVRARLPRKRDQSSSPRS